MDSYREVAISSFDLAKKQNEMLGRLLSLLNLATDVVRGKSPTPEEIREWREIVSEIRKDSPALSASLNEISKSLEGLIQKEGKTPSV